MTDRELIGLAARAAGYELHGWRGDKCYVIDRCSFDEHFDPFQWQPDESGEQALELASRCGMSIYFSFCLVCVGAVAISWPRDEPTAERAITRAAAEIGRGMV